jgi:hypothetical protein
LVKHANIFSHWNISRAGLGQRSRLWFCAPAWCSRASNFFS